MFTLYRNISLRHNSIFSFEERLNHLVTTMISPVSDHNVSGKGISTLKIRAVIHFQKLYYKMSDAAKGAVEFLLMLVICILKYRFINASKQWQISYFKAYLLFFSVFVKMNLTKYEVYNILPKIG